MVKLVSYKDKEKLIEDVPSFKQLSKGTPSFKQLKKGLKR